MKNLCKIFKTFCSKIDFSIRFFAQLLLLLKHVCLVIFGRQSKRETNFLVLDHSPSAHNSKGWTRLKLGAWNLIEVPRVGGMDPCLSHHLLRRRMCTSRNQPSRAELRQSKVLWYWMQTSQTAPQMLLLVPFNYLIDFTGLQNHLGLEFFQGVGNF